MNAMSIHQVAAAEEFASHLIDQSDSGSQSETSLSADEQEQADAFLDATSIDTQVSIQQSLESVGNGIQALLSESLTLATSEVTTNLQKTIHQYVQDSIKKGLPALGQQLQKEARKVAAVQAEQVTKKATAAYTSELKELQQQSADHQQADQSMSVRLDEAVSENVALKQAYEEQRKVIVALVRKVDALENHANTNRQHQQNTDQRLARIEHPSDLDTEWQDLLSSKDEDSDLETDSVA